MSFNGPAIDIIDSPQIVQNGKSVKVKRRPNDDKSANLLFFCSNFLLDKKLSALNHNN